MLFSFSLTGSGEGDLEMGSAFLAKGATDEAIFLAQGILSDLVLRGGVGGGSGCGCGCGFEGGRVAAAAAAGC